MASQPPKGRYRHRPVAPFHLPQDIGFADACQQVIDQLSEDIQGFNTIILDLPEGGSALNRPELLLSAIQRPFTTIGQTFVYTDGLLQAAALLYSLIQNHPFTDANKRTAFWGCAFFLQQCGYWRGAPFLNATEAIEYEQLILDVARKRRHRKTATLRTIHRGRNRRPPGFRSRWVTSPPIQHSARAQEHGDG